MATRRIKDITNTATTFASDDFIALDGATQGTRKMDKDDLIAEVSAGVSGDYLEEANNLSDVASLDTSKLNMEIPDVGTAPNEVPLNGQLGSMAYQSSEGISVGTVEAEALEVTNKITTKDVGGVPKGQIELQDSAYTISGGVNLGDIRHDAPRHRWYSGATVLAQFDEGTSYLQNTSLGIGTSSPVAGSKLEVVDGDIQATTSGSFCYLNSARATVPASSGYVIGGTKFKAYSTGSTYVSSAEMLAVSDGAWSASSTPTYLQLSTTPSGSTTPAVRWVVGSGGNLIAQSGVGIDFGSGATLDDYEEGTFTPTIYYQNPTGLSISYTNQTGYYTKIGNTVTVHAKVTWTVTGTPVNDNIGIQSFPFSFAATDLYLTCADSTGNSSVAQAGVSAYYAVAMSSSLTGNLADDIGSGSKTMIMSGTYQTTQ